MTGIRISEIPEYSVMKYLKFKGLARM